MKCILDITGDYFQFSTFELDNTTICRNGRLERCQKDQPPNFGQDGLLTSTITVSVGTTVNLRSTPILTDPNFLGLQVMSATGFEGVCGTSKRLRRPNSFFFLSEGLLLREEWRVAYKKKGSGYAKNSIWLGTLTPSAI